MGTFRSFTLAALLCVGTSACAPGTDAENAHQGHLALPLLATTPTGTTYRLTDVKLEIAGPVDLVLSGQSQVDGEPTLQADLVAGSYEITLRDGWSLVELDGDGESVKVAAILLSEPAATIEVLANARTVVSYRFQVGADAVTTASGIDVRIEVEQEQEPSTSACSQGEADLALDCADRYCADSDSQTTCFLSNCDAEIDTVSDPCQLYDRPWPRLGSFFASRFRPVRDDASTRSPCPHARADERVHSRRARAPTRLPDRAMRRERRPLRFGLRPMGRSMVSATKPVRLRDRQGRWARGCPARSRRCSVSTALPVTARNR